MKICFEFPWRQGGSIRLPVFEIPDSHPLPVVGMLLDLDLPGSPGGMNPEVIGNFRVVSQYWHVSGAPRDVWIAIVFVLQQEEVPAPPSKRSHDVDAHAKKLRR